MTLDLNYFLCAGQSNQISLACVIYMDVCINIMFRVGLWVVDTQNGNEI